MQKICMQSKIIHDHNNYQQSSQPRQHVYHTYRVHMYQHFLDDIPRMNRKRPPSTLPIPSSNFETCLRFPSTEIVTCRYNGFVV